MSYFNPLLNSLIAGQALQRAHESEKERQVRRAQAVAKNAAAEGDRFERAVESDDAINPTHGDDEPHREPPEQRKKKRPPEENGDGEPPHLDLKA